jgi:hypothetical protein
MLQISFPTSSEYLEPASRGGQVEHDLRAALPV